MSTSVTFREQQGLVFHDGCWAGGEWETGERRELTVPRCLFLREPGRRNFFPRPRREQIPEWGSVARSKAAGTDVEQSKAARQTKEEEEFHLKFLFWPVVRRVDY